MNQVFAGVIALLIAYILWASKKHSKGSPFFKPQKDSLQKSNATYSFVQKNKIINQKEPKSRKKIFKSKPFENQSLLNSIETNKKLTKLFSGNPNDRLLAIQIASQWENKKAIPFLRKGLKDSDRRVVIASAAAISLYKGKTINLQKKSQASRPPRNVSLMR